MSIPYFVELKTTFNMVPRDKFWESLQQLGVPLYSQHDVKAIYTTIYAYN